MSTSDEYAYAKFPWRRRVRHPYMNHLRNRQINITLDELKLAAPFENGMRVVMWGLALLLVVTMFTNMVIGVFGFDPPLWFLVLFLGTVCWAVFAIITFGWWRWNRRKEPETRKVICGGGRMLYAADWSPGMYLANVDLPRGPITKMPTTVKETESAPVAVEIIPHKRTMQGVPQPVRKSLFAVTVAVCRVRDAKTGKLVAGYDRGLTYHVPASSEPHVSGDIPNWRGYDWYGLAVKHLGKKKVRRNTLINLMAEGMDPDTWGEPSEDRVMKKELFVTKQYELNLSVEVASHLGRQATREDLRKKAYGEK